MRDGDAGRPHGARPGEKVVSIVERIEQKQMARLRELSAKRHIRELEATVEWFDLKKQLETMDLDAQLEAPAPADTPEVRRQRGGLRCMRGLLRCLHGEVDAGHAEWAEVVADVPELALPHMLRARWLMASEPRSALAHFDRAAELEPTDANVYWRRGDCHARLGDHDRALANYRRALALDPDSIDGLHSMGKALVALGKPAEGIRYYDQAIARAPRYVDFYEARGIAHEVQGQYAAAVRDYERILELDPARVVARFARARCNVDRGEPDAAIAELTEIVTQTSDAHLVHLLLGKAYLQKAQLAPAFEALSRAVEAAPDMDEAWLQRALVLVRMGERDRAVADAERAAELAPQQAEYVYTALALRGGDPAARIAALEGPIARFPDTGLFLQERAEIHVQQGDHERALTDWERILARWPDEVDARLGRARALGALERHAEALEEVERAIELEPDNAMAYGLRASYRDQLEVDEAVVGADWDRAAELGPDEPAIRYYRGRYRMLRERYEAAIADFDRSIALVPRHAEAYYHRACCRYQIDDEHADDEDWEEDEATAEARYRACLADLERALELGHREEDLFVQLHWVHWQLHDREAAAAALERGIEAYPGYAFFYRLRADRRHEMKDDEGAAADRARAETLWGRSGEAG
jgi:tetratricopeptide (TPR) repeat protein